MKVSKIKTKATKKRAGTLRKATTAKKAATVKTKASPIIKKATATKRAPAKVKAPRVRKGKPQETAGELAKEFQRNLARAGKVEAKRGTGSSFIDGAASHKITRLPTDKNTDIWVKSPGRSDLIGIDNAGNNTPTLKRDIKRLNRVKKK
jgi:hypothetical protein